jgi:septal ring factor EnvC (AmiA/AmiB activator)
VVVTLDGGDTQSASYNARSRRESERERERERERETEREREREREKERERERESVQTCGQCHDVSCGRSLPHTLQRQFF